MIYSNNYSFRTHWIDEQERFQAELLYNNEVLETETFDYQDEMFNYIADTMAALQIAGENWILTQIK